MKVVILSGGLGTRISEESHLRPKPMIEIDAFVKSGNFNFSSVTA
jgi:choline kinase